MTQTKARGFTLIEVLVALVGLALMAGLSWRGLDSMVRARDASQQRIDEVAVVQTALAQWRTDLDAATRGIANLSGWAWNARGEVDNDLYAGVLRPHRKVSVAGAGLASRIFVTIGSSALNRKYPILRVTERCTRVDSFHAASNSALPRSNRTKLPAGDGDTRLG